MDMGSFSWDDGTKTGAISTCGKIIGWWVSSDYGPFLRRQVFGDTLEMKIEAITIRELQMPLVHFFETSFGRTYSRRVLLITAHCEGVDGWSECVAGENPFYSPE